MAAYLGRRLLQEEVVHHKDEVKDNNSPANLELMLKVDHDRLPKPAIKPISCPHCNGLIEVSGRVRCVRAILPAQLSQG